MLQDFANDFQLSNDNKTHLFLLDPLQPVVKRLDKINRVGQAGHSGIKVSVGHFKKFFFWLLQKNG
jgi:hypothetical protein